MSQLQETSPRAGASGVSGVAPAAGFYEYQIANSIRFNGTDQALEKTWGSAATNDNAKTISVWIKRSGSGNSAIGSTTNTKICSANDFNQFEINTGNPSGFSDQFGYFCGSAGTKGAWQWGKWRDPSAWIHIVWIYNSDESTTTDRVKVYLNGINQPIGDSSIWNYTNSNLDPYPPSGVDSEYGLNGNEMHIARYWYNDAGWYGGQMADFIMVDGTAVIGDFGEFKNGVWIPVDPSGLTFGTNGFWLDFANSSAFGNDVSGNNNDFAHIGTIPTHAQLIDSPTFGSEGSANFPAWSPIIPSAVNLSEGNFRFDCTTSARSSMTTWAIPPDCPTKYYVECLVKQVSNFGITFGLANPDVDLGSSIEGASSMNGFLFVGYSGSVWYTNALVNGVRQGWSSDVGMTSARVMAITIDRVANEIKCYFDNTLIPNGTISISATETYHIVGSVSGGSNAAVHMNINAGQDSTGGGDFSAGTATDENGYGTFQHAPPSGFLALCSANLSTAEEIDPAETEDDFPKKLFNTWRYTGNNSERTIDTSADGNGYGVKFDLFLPRSDIYSQNPYVLNTTAGIFGASSNNYYMKADGNGAQDTLPQYNFVSQSDTDYVLTGGTWFNSGAVPLLNFGWRLNGGTTASNASGDITSVGQADPSGSMSCFTYTGTGTGGNTVAHHLSQAPDLLICKRTNSTNNWMVTAGTTYMNSRYLYLDTDAAAQAGLYQGGRSFTANAGASLVALEGAGEQNGSGDSYMALAFSKCDGYIAIGEYEGNANTNGTFVYTGFKPAWLMVKYVAGTEGWIVSNNLRSPYNPVERILKMNNSNVEADGSTYDIDYLSNGFKPRTTWEGYNGSSYTMLYIAFAEQPFAYATAR